MNDSEAACFGAEVLEYHCSVCDFVRLAVRPVNSDEKTQGSSLDLDMDTETLKKNTGSSEAWSIFFFFFFFLGSEPKWQWLGYFAGFVWSQFVSDFKNKHTVAKPLSLAKRGWLVGENPMRNDSVTLVRKKPTLRRSLRREKRQWLGLLCGLRLKSIYVQLWNEIHRCKGLVIS